MSDLEAVLRRIIRSRKEREVRFAIVGGLAVSARSEPRFTRDADLCVAVGSDAEARKHWSTHCAATATPWSRSSNRRPRTGSRRRA